MTDPKIPIHYCWVQGQDALPEAYRENLAEWLRVLPPGFELVAWDDVRGKAEFPFYARFSDFMTHAAMQADVILLSAQVRFGGLVIGTDMRPNQAEGLFEIMERSSGFVIHDVSGAVYNGMSFAAEPWDRRFQQILACIESDPSRFADRQVPNATGPLRWSAILRDMDHGLDLISDRRAWTRSYWDKQTTRPDAWVDPGFAASHRIGR